MFFSLLRIVKAKERMNLMILMVMKFFVFICSFENEKLLQAKTAMIDFFRKTRDEMFCLTMRWVLHSQVENHCSIQ